MEETPFAPPPGLPPVDPPSPEIIPWEDPQRPWPGALVDTVRLLLISPRRAFARVPVRGDVLRPVLFALALGWLGLCFTALWELTLGNALRNMMPGGSDGATYGPPRLFYLAMIPLGPLYVALGILLNSAILHVALLLVGGAKNGYTATLRAVCYTQAANVGLVLPFCGSLLASVAVLVLEVIGISVLHRIPLVKAMIAVLIPAAVCCACIAGIALFGAALMGGGMKGLMP